MNALNRLAFLSRLGGGFGALAITDLLAHDFGKGRPELNGGLHHPAKVRRVIQLFMNGGASQWQTATCKVKQSDVKSW